MPTAGDEGYERMVVCPYDRAHEVRAGRMQYHLDKCRENHKTDSAKYEICVLNSSHVIPKVEMEYHQAYECDGRKDWLRNRVKLGNVKCPVADLVPVNAGIVPEGDECWDNVESSGSVLDKIKEEAPSKQILRLMQCQSKAKRKSFRNSEKVRHAQWDPNCQPSSSSSSVQGDEPMVLQQLKTAIPVKRQDPAEALETLNRVFNTLEISPEQYPQLSPKGSLKNQPAATPSAPNVNRPPSAASGASYASWASAAPSTSGSGSVPGRRPTIAMNIVASAGRANTSGDGFSTVPIPGRGRGRRLAP